ncbi:MAG TPA: hypothetical protein VJN29_04520 [Intrasporangium sp.]|uniref:hypothetical protein n=1 Tax=Intrasporangium sp. TaxID=1925024 RepID=UPI002B461F1F|nr:hypothetical protein [Intrasporangium sp.]HKX66468.1 hypothetical protein [Intrasporangium sp.]
MTEQLNTETAPPTRRATLLDLSVTQLIAGSLAAATAAFLGSRLGVLGTISGAAIGSVVSAIAASLYTASMTRAREALRWRELLSRQAHSKPQNAPPPTPSSVQSAPTSPPSSSVQSAPTSPSSSVQDVPVRPPRRVLATAGVLFALAIAFLTGLQLASGADVTGTSVGTRRSAGQLERPVSPTSEDPPGTSPRGPGATSESATPTPQPPAQATTDAPEPASEATGTAPSVPAEPTPTQTSTVDPTAPGDPAPSPSPTQPTHQVAPTTPGG